MKSGLLNERDFIRRDNNMNLNKINEKVAERYLFHCDDNVKSQRSRALAIYATKSLK